MDRTVSLIITLALISASLLLPSCELIDSLGITDSIQDSLVTVICPAPEEDMYCIDLFAYGDGPLKRLEGHVRLGSGCDTVRLKLPAGEKIIVGIANSRLLFNDEALDAFDTMESLRLFYRDEERDRLKMSASAVCLAGDTLGLRLSSPLCRIELRSIEHSFSGYRRLEDPVMYLEDANAYMEALRRDSFNTAETVSDTSGMKGLAWDRLPSDIGMYPQHPGTCLYCYPNESSVRPTQLVVEGTVTGGDRYRFVTRLPPMGYADRVDVELVIADRPDKYEFKIYR